MNEFEKMLVAKCSPCMILLFAEIYSKEASQEFKNYVTENFKGAQSKDELLKMSVQDFFDVYAKDERRPMRSHLLNIFHAYDIETVDDLLALDAQRILQFRNSGKKNLEAIQRICHNAGLEFK